MMFGPGLYMKLKLNIHTFNTLHMSLLSQSMPEKIRFQNCSLPGVWPLHCPLTGVHLLPRLRPLCPGVGRRAYRHLTIRMGVISIIHSPSSSHMSPEVMAVPNEVGFLPAALVLHQQPPVRKSGVMTWVKYLQVSQFSRQYCRQSSIVV